MVSLVSRVFWRRVLSACRDWLDVLWLNDGVGGYLIQKVTPRNAVLHTYPWAWNQLRSLSAFGSFNYAEKVMAYMTT